VFPAGWDAPEVRLTCGNEADRFQLGACDLRWAYILAIIGALDGIVLGILGFVLGSRHVKLSDEMGRGESRKHYGGSSSYHPSGYFPTDTGPTPSVITSYASTKRSMNLHPIVLLPPEMEGYSDFSRSKASLYRAEYATPSQQFQL
jgi:hypothetical protein